jgi:hypothetical protein
MNNFIAAIKGNASWGYFDYRMKGEPFEAGYQSVPVDWGINSREKKLSLISLKKLQDTKNILINQKYLKLFLQ